MVRIHVEVDPRTLEVAAGAPHPVGYYQWVGCTALSHEDLRHQIETHVAEDLGGSVLETEDFGEVELDRLSENVRVRADINKRGIWYLGGRCLYADRDEESAEDVGPEEQTELGTNEAEDKFWLATVDAERRLIKSESLRWAWARTLPAISLAVYAALALWAWPIEIEGFDLVRTVHPGERIAIALNSPLLLFVWGGSPQPADWWVGALPVILVWYSIGWWLERYELPLWLKSARSWTSTRMLGVGLAAAALLGAGAYWLDYPLDILVDVVIGLVIWPIIFVTMAVQVLKGRTRI